jgi:GGDEF domain-containing protein
VERISGAVNQAAPVLANLRNLAIAEHRAATDGLTGLPNARSMREALVRMVAQAGRSVQPLGAVALDLDHSRRSTAATATRPATRRLPPSPPRSPPPCARATSPAAGAARSSWSCSRTPAWRARRCWAEKLRAAVGTIEIPGVPGCITVSAGVAVVPDHAADADELLRAADRALYAAKAAGRNCVARAGDSAEAATAGSR